MSRETVDDRFQVKDLVMGMPRGVIIMATAVKRGSPFFVLFS